MPISFVAAGAVASGANPSVPVPAGYQQGDLLLLITAGTATPTTPSGWTLVSTQSGQSLTVYRKFATGSESSVTVSVAGTTTRAVMVAYRGVSATDTVSPSSSGTGFTAQPQPLTTSFANEYIVMVYAAANVASDWTANASTTERVNSSSSATLRGLLIADEFKAAAGASTARNALLSASNTWATISVSIIPSDRYWVGGSGTWDTGSTTGWSFSSGGASGAPVPTAQDNVFFDQAGTYTVTLTGAITCFDFTVSAGTVTFAGSGTPAISGSFFLNAATVWNGVGAFTFNATATGKTITTNSVFMSSGATGINWNFTGIGGGWTLGSALTGNPRITVDRGTFDTGNYTLTTGTITSTSGFDRTINLGSSTVVFGSGIAGLIFNLSATGLTVNAGTSTLTTASFVTGTFNGGNQTFYNVSFTSTSSNITWTITGTNTFNNLSFVAPASPGATNVTFDSRQTINGTLSTTGTAGNRRVFFASATYGISQDLVVNSAPSLTDADFRGLYVSGTSAPISGTRIGNRGECRGITFSTPKTVYWNLGGSAQWNANAWATTSTGTPSTDNFPLPQDTATFTNAGAAGTVSPNAALCNVDLSARTSAFTMSFGVAVDCYGNWTNGSGVTFSGTSTLTFSGGTTQTITSAGKTFTCPITVDTYGGTVQLADALNIGTQLLTVTNGTFSTAGYAVTGILLSDNSNVRTINLGASTITFNSNATSLFSTPTNLTFNCGTSTLNFVSGGQTFNGGGQTFYNVSISSSTVATFFNGTNVFNNLTLQAPGSASVTNYFFAANQTINGTLTCAGASAVRRIFLRSSTLGTPRTITAAAISATDCDFRDINLAGAASGATPTRAGNCGGNSGITFPAAKTVYWNLAGAQNWSATGWAPSSGGTPDINNFPLAQDTAVFDNTGSVTGTITINTIWNIGTFDASLRTSAMTLTTGTNAFAVIYGDWKFGTGVTSGASGFAYTFSKNGTQTITSNGVQFGVGVTINHPLGTVQLADALSIDSTSTLSILGGAKFDAVTYNVTTGFFQSGSSGNTVLMGSGTWTMTGISNCWSITAIGSLIVGSSTIVLSNTSSTARTFVGGGLYYNKLTIGGTTGTSLLTITGANTFGELASTKTVAHTITFPSSTTTTIGKWAVTGTVGNVVTVNSSTAATAFTLSIAGPANSGIDYLSVRDCTVATDSPGEFYAGANSTNVSGNTRVIFTATPAARTLYWVGGTGNWSSTTKWSTSSGGGSGAAIPTSLDAVVFDSASNATAYTATIDAGVTLARCASFTMAGPLSGNVTFAGTVGIAFHGNVSFAATGITRTYTGAMQWAGNSSYTFTTNGLALDGQISITGVGSTWTLGSSFSTGQSFFINFGGFDTGSYSCTVNNFTSTGVGVRSLTLGASTVSATTSFNFGTSASVVGNFLFSAGTSSVSCGNVLMTLNGNGQTFNNVSFTNAAATGITITGANTFNTLSFAGRTTVGITPVTFSANQTITTLTLNAGTAAAYRTFLASDTIGTQRTLTVTTLTAGAADYDFRDIAIAGGAAPIAPTRAGDGKGNSGITFPAAKTVYWVNASSENWGRAASGNWSSGSGSAPSPSQFPLAQDTAVFPISPTPYPSSGNTVTINANYNIGTIDMSLRTANTMTLATGTTTPQIYGNWINGTGTTLTGTGNLIFAGRGSQTITSAGKIFSQPIRTDAVSGSVTLQDAITIASTTINSIQLFSGTFNANNYNVTLSSSTSAVGLSSTTNARTLAIGSGTWVIAGNGGWNATTSTNLTVTGTGTISLTSASAKAFSGGGISYSGITLNQGGAGALTISGNNTFKDITNTYSATGAATIALGNTTQTVTNFTGTGAATRVLTLSGTSAASPATLIITGSVGSTIDYINVSNVRGYPLTNSWKIGANSTNSGSLGFFFETGGGTTYAVFISESSTGADTFSVVAQLASALSESATGSDQVSSLQTASSVVLESISAADAAAAGLIAASSISESAQGQDTNQALVNLAASVAEQLGLQDQVTAVTVFGSSVQENAAATDAAISVLAAAALVEENATAADATNSVLTAVASVSESNTALDSVNTLMAAESFVSENAVVEDTAASSIIVVSAVDEDVEVSDASAAQLTASSSVSEIGQISELIATQLAAVALVDETGTAVDSVSTVMTAQSSVSESVNAADAASSSFTVGSAVNETAQVADILAAQMTAQSSVAENAQVADQAAAQQVALVQIADTVQALDAQSAQLDAAALISESVRAVDQVSSGYVAQSQVSETAQALDQTSSNYIVLSDVSETANVQDTANAAFVAGSAVSESAQAQDTAAAAQTHRSSTSETARPSDAAATSAVFSVQVLAGTGGLPSVTENTSAYPLGTSFTGSQFFSGSSAGNGVSVVANGTGTGSTGGFNAGGNNIRFGGTGTTGARNLTTVALDLTTAVSVTLNAISGNNSNGGEVPDAGEGLVLQYSPNGTTFTLIDSLMVPGNPSYPLSPTFSNFVKTIPLAAKTAATFLRIQQVSSSGGGFDNYGIRTITITRSGGTSSVGVSDSLQAGGTYNAPVADTVRVQDSAAARMTAGGAVAESAIAQDAVTPDLQIFRSVQELAEGSDQLQAAATFRGTVQDSSRTQDVTASGFVPLAAVSETARGQDQEAARVSFGSQIQESAAAQDSTARQLIVPRTVSENARGLDALTAGGNFTAATLETARISDQPSAGMVAESAVSEQASMADSVVGIRVLFGIAAESARASDQGNATLAAGARIAERVYAQDTVASTAVFISSIAELGRALDTSAGFIIVPASVAELAYAQDSGVGFITFPTTIVEGATGAELTAVQATFRALIAEQGSGQDTVDAPGSTYNAQVVQSIQVEDSLFVNGTYNAAIGETLVVLDQASAAYLWTLVDDSQTPNWQGMPAVQVAGWVQVDDTQTTNWQNVPSAQGATWTEVDTENTPNWQQEPPP